MKKKIKETFLFFCYVLFISSSRHLISFFPSSLSVGLSAASLVYCFDYACFLSPQCSAASSRLSADATTPGPILEYIPAQVPTGEELPEEVPPMAPVTAAEIDHELNIR
jgi:hypothetical protein